jgi:hypothetical protein
VSSFEFKVETNPEPNHHPIPYLEIHHLMCPLGRNRLTSSRIRQSAEQQQPCFVVDWELTKAGLAGLDVGQFCVELAMLRRLRPGDDARVGAAAGETLASFVRAYFSTGDVAVSVGVGHQVDKEMRRAFRRASRRLDGKGGV